VTVPEGTKGVPLAVSGMTLETLATSGRNVLREGFPMPLMVLKESALETNLAAMAAFCDSHGALLCPHGKTTMSPQLFRRQIDAGAWGLTAATPSHLRLYRRFGVQRVFYANELVEPAVIEWIAAELERSPNFELFCLVDSVEGVALLDQGLRTVPERVAVLLEVGYPGGRCGVRSRETAREVAAAVDASRALRLCGIECFEGLLTEDESQSAVEKVDNFLEFVESVTTDLIAHSSLGQATEVLMSAGGSAYFDRVVRAFGDGSHGPANVRLILRSGCYLTQDGGFYDLTSPLGKRRNGAAVLQDAIEIWSAVLSRPEPQLAITSMGRRDAPTDIAMPEPKLVSHRGRTPVPFADASVRTLNDQHAHLVVDEACELGPGDLVGYSISHPCTAFDKWRVIPIVDDAYRVCDAIMTFF
jgi:D-serine dehydratase